MSPPWQVLAWLTALFVFFGGILVMVIQSLLKSNQDHSDKRFGGIEESHRTLRGDLERRFEQVEREQRSHGEGLSQLRADHSSLCSDLPRSYVAREDWIRFSTTIDAKLDALHREGTESERRVRDEIRRSTSP